MRTRILLVLSLAACGAPQSESAVVVDTPLASPDSALIPRFELQSLKLLPEESALAALRLQFGGTLQHEDGNESGDYRLCYRVGSAERTIGVIFGATSMGGPEHSLAFVEVSEAAPSQVAGVECPAIDGPFTVTMQGAQLKLGASAADFERGLRTAPERQGDTLTFEWVRQELGPYKTIGAGKDTIVAFDVFTQVRAIIPAGRVRAFSVLHMSTY